MSPPLVSVLVPAYGQPELLSKALRSVLRQDYRPLEVIVSDDCSRLELEPADELLQVANDQEVHLLWFRQSTNLGAYGNMHFCWTQATGDYLMYLPHDDELVSTEFLASAVHELERVENRNVFIANSSVEDHSGVDRFAMDISSPGQPTVYEFQGNEFVVNWLFERAHPAYSAVVLRKSALRKRDYDATWLSRRVIRQLGIEPDEGFAGIVLAASDSRVVVSTSVVSRRGRPETSWSKTTYWQWKGCNGLLLQYRNLARVLTRSGAMDLAEFVRSLNSRRAYRPFWFSLRMLLYLGPLTRDGATYIAAVLHPLSLRRLAGTFVRSVRS